MTSPIRLAWQVIWCQPGDYELGTLPDKGWNAVPVPQSLCDAAGFEGDADEVDWWYRTRTTLAEGSWTLELAGAATYAEVYADGELVASGRSAFTPLRVVLTGGRTVSLVVHIRSLRAEPVPSRPRARWRSSLVPDNALRWHRTSLQGHMPGQGSSPIVGLWRPVTLQPTPPVRIASLCTEWASGSGLLTLELVCERPGEVHLTCAGAATSLPVDGPATIELDVGAVRPWWPHTHGEPVTYPLRLEVDGVLVHERQVGFRHIAADHTDGGFALQVNGIEIFARGAVWTPVEPVGDPEVPVLRREALVALRDAGANVVRVPGTSWYADDEFLTACDDLGLLVWQDLMLATFDPPFADERWTQTLHEEVEANISRGAAHPSLAVISGGTETLQQPVLSGLSAERRELPGLYELVGRVTALAPGCVVVPSSPCSGVPQVAGSRGGALATSARRGLSHWFGVGGYRRPLSEARTSGVRFAAECLALGCPPPAYVVRESWGPDPFGDPVWTAGDARDTGADWTFLEVTEHYANELFPSYQCGRLHRLRVTAFEVIRRTLAEWRRTASVTKGAIVLSARDVVPGPGYGVLTVDGARKAGWYAMARALGSTSLQIVDEGLDGLDLHVHHDGPRPLAGVLTLSVLRADGTELESAQRAVEVAPRGSLVVNIEAELGAFRDLNGAWRAGFGGDSPYAAVRAEVAGVDEVIHLLQPLPPVEIARLTIRVLRDAVELETDTALAYADVTVPGRELDRAFVHLLPGIPLRVTTKPAPVSGQARAAALNAQRVRPVVIAEAPDAEPDRRGR
ncbi:hypothetical protein G9U51_12430 [Calidifontibacter sp. DB0510]|uniref:Beta-mannosidase n=1 Tax=Metallococcus carri TaxID=1656884 RepID=A0A967B0L1_9MICO|nr:hypothetical protein [Metallococcus carri]NHN56586.1 hypothetical protein [Metallococcus carri]NOP38885.1 hypothetical protein [Calidifontibacter sp. DB2511S]